MTEKKASIQADIAGNLVSKRTESAKTDIFRQGAFEAKLPTNAPENVQKRKGAMEDAERSEEDGGGRKFTDEQIDDWVTSYCENRVRLIPDKPKKDRKKDDREGLAAELYNYVTSDEEPTCEKETIVKKSVIFSTDLFSIKAGVDTLDRKLNRWELKLKKAQEKAAKAKVGSKAREKAAEAERTVAGEKRQWVQGAMRVLPKTTIDNKGAWDFHGDKLHDAIFEGKGLRKKE